MALPRTGHFPQNLIQWSNGVNFEGFALIAFIPPIGYSVTNLGLMMPSETLPQFAIVPIINGLFNSGVSLYFSADNMPPNTKHSIAFYDTTKTLIAGPSAAFSVDADPIATITIPTLTAPSAGGIAPTPDS